MVTTKWLEMRTRSVYENKSGRLLVCPDPSQSGPGAYVFRERRVAIAIFVDPVVTSAVRPVFLVINMRCNRD